MSNDYSKNWDELPNNRDYFDTSDIYLQDKYRLIKILISYVNNFSAADSPEILDLGCGDGLLSKNLLENNSRSRITALDGSESVLEKAKNNLQNYKNVKYINSAFEDIEKNISDQKFDFIVSSFAIHHIEPDMKYDFFKRLFELLKPGGCFINIDTCISSNKNLSSWYYELWREWIKEYQEYHKVKEDFSGLPDKAPKAPENHYQDLDEQVSWLRDIGFTDADCFYKYGIFCIYGGRRSE